MRKKFTKIALLLASMLVLASIPAVADEFGTPPDFLDLVPATDNNTPTDLDDFASGYKYDTPPDFIDLIPIVDDNKPFNTIVEPTNNIEAQQIIVGDVNNTVVNVVVPISLIFTIDPLELAGRGSVYSDAYMIKNLGDSDVVLKITDITVTYAAGKEFTPLAEPFSGESGKNDIYLALGFDRVDTPPIIMTAQEDMSRDIPLSGIGSDLSNCELRIFGSVNPYPLSAWSAGDVKININYQIETINEPEIYIPQDGFTAPVIIWEEDENEDMKATNDTDEPDAQAESQEPDDEPEISDSGREAEVQNPDSGPGEADASETKTETDG